MKKSSTLIFFVINQLITINNKAIVSVVFPDLDTARNFDVEGSMELNILATELGSRLSKI